MKRAFALLSLIALNAPEVVDKSQLPEKLAKTSVVPCTENASECLVHVFRVQLTGTPNGTAQTSTFNLPLKRKPKYGHNVYAPVGNNESQRLAEQIVAKMGDGLNSRVQERVRKGEFLIAPVDDEELKAELRSFTTKHPRQRQTKKQIHQKPTTEDENHPFPVSLILLLVAIGVLIGILCAGLCVLVLDYRRIPRVDRSSAISYKLPACGGRRIIVDEDGHTRVFERNTFTDGKSPRPPRSRPPRIHLQYDSTDRVVRRNESARIVEDNLLQRV